MSRRLNTALRSSLLMAAGASLIVAPLMAGLSAAALVSGVAVGALAVAVGIAGTALDGRGTVSLSAHAAFDRGLGGGLLASALAFGVTGQRGALALFGAVGLVVLGLAAVTRYTISPAHSR